MGDLLIRGMEMPKEEEIDKCIIVRHDGEVLIVEFDNLIECGYVAYHPASPMRAVPVPSHGDLIDADALEKYIDKYIGGEQTRSRFHHWVQVQRTVIPDDEGEHI